MKFVRTPEERFTDLPDWPHEPRYCDDLTDFEGLRMHYVDVGPADAPTLLCLHGEPTWSYLYRKMIPVFLESGYRVVAPDFFGFGRSDKPIEDADYTWSFHRRSLLAFIRNMELSSFGLVCQDWGGLLGLTLPLDLPNAIDRLLVMNTALAVGVDPSPGFSDWKKYVASQPDLDVARLMKRAVSGLTDDEARAYAAPFPDPLYKAGVRRFPELVAVQPDMEGVADARAASQWWSQHWAGRSFMAIGLDDPVLGAPVMQLLHSTIRDCPEPLELPGVGHFVQEAGEPVARAAVEAWGST
jgi:pimeloyl-ACP methyl ester carboxylesterase